MALFFSFMMATEGAESGITGQAGRGWGEGRLRTKACYQPITDATYIVVEYSIENGIL